jgi:CubicO group peptidase (beta-lactamase class C family)
MRQAVAAVALALSLLIGSCSGPSESVLRQALTEGYWRGSVGAYDFVHEFILESGASGDRLAGVTHQVDSGRQRTAATMAGVSLDGVTLEISYSALPPYRGRIDLETGSITGGHPDAQGYEELSLERVDPIDWPMIPARPVAAHGGLEPAWTRPPDRPGGWPTATPQEAAIDRTAIDRTLGAVVAGEAGWLHSLLIVRGGGLVVEEYFHGWQVDDLHRIASCTKSVSSLLVGIAVDRGEIEGVAVPLLEFFPDRRAVAGEGWETLRLEHLLTMSMGLDWSPGEAGTFSPPGQDPFTDVIARNVRRRPGSQFRYVSRDMKLLSAVLFKAAGRHADVYAAEHLFAPLGIDSWDWENNRYQGHPDMSGTLKLRPRDMAKIGQLVLDGGTWQGQPVVSADWIRAATSIRFHPSADDEYGYLWWGLDDPPPGIDFAAGTGSQYILVVPVLDLVVVTTGGNELSDRQSAILGVLREGLLPGFESR